MKKTMWLMIALLASCGGGGRMLVFKLMPGPQGVAGNDGSDGQGCSVLQVDVGDVVLPYGGAVVDCGASSALISNGEPGDDGLNAPPTAYTITELVDPCGDMPGIHDEVFFRLANGTLIASFSDSVSGTNTRLSVLKVGSYQTTDNSHCFFSVDSNNEVQNEHY